MTDKRIKKLVVVGGGTAGWIAAAAFSRLLESTIDIELVESDQIGTVGVGEATIPQIIRLNHILGFDENEFIRRTNGTFKLGIEFVDWFKIGGKYLHTFGEPGINLANVHFHQYWLRHALNGGKASLWDYSLHQRAADENKFSRLNQIGNTSMSGLAYAFHFDAGLYAQFLREYAESRGVERTEGVIRNIDLHAESGDITSLILDSGKIVEGDFFIDCTGFRSLLLGDHLGVGYTDWSHWLPCNRAIAVPSSRLSPLPPYTRATAKTAGWQWRIPLQHRTGNGHVYCNEYISDDEATAELLSAIEGDAHADPKYIKFTTGHRKKFWQRNCVAIGLSSGFLEPLESTSIHLIQSNISRLISLFPRGKLHEADRDEYNRRTKEEFEQIRDFLILHYHVNQRHQKPFWEYCRSMAIPEPLQQKIDLFKASGRIGRDTDDLFKDASWSQVMIGQGIMPKDYNPMTDKLSPKQIQDFFSSVRRIIDKSITPLPSHEDFIRQNCASKETIT